MGILIFKGLSGRRLYKAFGIKWLTLALDGVGGQRHTAAALPPGKTRYPFYRRLCGPQGRSGRVDIHSMSYRKFSYNVCAKPYLSEISP
jgi:hypothetical protein